MNHVKLNDKLDKHFIILVRLTYTCIFCQKNDFFKFLFQCYCKTCV